MRACCGMVEAMRKGQRADKAPPEYSDMLLLLNCGSVGTPARASDVAFEAELSIILSSR